MSVPRVSHSLLVNEKEIVIGFRIQFEPTADKEKIAMLKEHIMEEIEWFFTVEDKS